MKHVVTFACGMLCLMLFSTACGKAGKKQAPAAGAASVPMPSQPGNVQQGIDLAKEILANFDQAVAEAGALAAAKPEASELKPQLQALIDSYRSKMVDANVRYLELQRADPAAFAAANGYLGDNRPRHVQGLYAALDKIIAHYNLQVGDPEAVRLLSSGIIELIDAAVHQDPI
jgi:hypothetical protein